MLYQVKDKFLYILRSINDAGIVWMEGIPKIQEEETEDRDLTDEERDQWVTLCEETGRTSALIFQDLTGFYPIPKEEMK